MRGYSEWLFCCVAGFVFCAPAAGENLILNASFELGLRHGWCTGGKYRVEGEGGVGQLLMYEIPVDSTQSLDGKSSMKLRLFGNGFRGQLKHALVKLKAGVPHVLSMYAKSDVSDVSAKIEIGDGSRSRGGKPLFVREFELANQWKRLQLGFIPPGNDGWDPGDLPLQPGGFLVRTQGRTSPDHYSIRIRFYSNGTSSVWVDAVQLEEGEKASPFSTSDAVEVGLLIDEPDARYANIFLSGEPVKIDLIAYNSSATARTEEFDIRIVDINEQRVWKKTIVMTLAGNGIHREVLEPDFRRTGVFRAEVRYKGKEDLLEELVFSVLRPMRNDIAAEEASLGSRMYVPGGAVDVWMLRMFRRIGIRWVRVLAQDPFDWCDVQPEKDTWVWYDDRIRRIKEHGIEILPCIRLRYDSIPAWARTDMPDRMFPVRDADVAKYIEAMVGHYKNEVKYWEILNEPDKCDPTRGLHLLKVAREAAKRADPGSFIVGPCANKARFVEPWLKGGGLDLVDGIYSFHYSGSGLNDAEIIELCGRAIDYSRRDGKHRTVWNTEENGRLASYPFYRRFHETLGGGERKLFLEPRRGAGFIARLYVLNRAMGIEKLFLWCYYYTPTYAIPRTVQSRPFEYDGALGPTGVALSTAANLLDGFTAVGKKLVSPGFTAYLFERKGNTIAVVWKTANVEETTTAMRRPARVEVLDMMGNPIEGRVLDVGESPIYLVGKGMRSVEVKKILGDLTSVGR